MESLNLPTRTSQFFAVEECFCERPNICTIHQYWQNALEEHFDVKRKLQMDNNTDLEEHTYANKVNRSIKITIMDLYPSNVAADILKELGMKRSRILSVV